MWMTSASLIGIWLSLTRSVRKIIDTPIQWVTIGLVVVTLLCRSLGALLLMALVLAALLEIRWLRRPTILIFILLIPLVYVTVRASTDWGAAQLVAAAKTIDERRSESLGTRLHHDRQLVVRALERPWFGWGGWGRNRIQVNGKDVSITDGLWVSIVGRQGLTGLISWLGITLLPPAYFIVRVKPRNLVHPVLAPMTAAAAILGMLTIDWLMNAFTNPTYFVMAGGLVAVTSKLAWVKGRLGVLEARGG